MPTPLANSSRAVLADGHAPAHLRDDWTAGGFGIYIHWPFCAAKCPYCDFNSHVVDAVDHERWKRAFLAEIDRYADWLPGRTLNAIFLGGGTPSLMDPETVAAVIERIRRHWPVANDLEVTLEANPGSVEAGRFSAFAAAGVSRVSIGVQALNDPDLRRLGRIHSTAEAMQAIAIARERFARVSFDLIYARQHQTVQQWQDELRRALDMAPDHLSLYQLTIEPGTAFGARRAAGGLKGLPDEDRAADMYSATQDVCDAAGLPAYEVSNHARPRSESRHNLIYWRYGDYIGIGPGAHGRITRNGQRHATETWTMPERWLKAAEEGQGECAIRPLRGQEQAEEYVMMGLRIAEGLEMDRFARLRGTGFDSSALKELQDLEMITIEGRRLRVTAAGRPILNAVIRALLS